MRIDGAGSTAGCVSPARAELLPVLKWLDPAGKPRTVMAALADLRRLGNTVDPAGVTTYRDHHVRARSAAALRGGSRVRSSDRPARRRRYANLTLPQKQQNPGEGWLPHARFWRAPPGNGARTS
jgi:hypothetical protein